MICSLTCLLTYKLAMCVACCVCDRRLSHDSVSNRQHVLCAPARDLTLLLTHCGLITRCAEKPWSTAHCLGSLMTGSGECWCCDTAHILPKVVRQHSCIDCEPNLVGYETEDCA